jgi:hypothetical protein
MQRVSQMEDQLQGLLSEAEADGAQLSRADWNIMRKRMLHIWALRYHRIGRKGKLEVRNAGGEGRRPQSRQLRRQDAWLNRS